MTENSNEKEPIDNEMITEKITGDVTNEAIESNHLDLDYEYEYLYEDEESDTEIEKQSKVLKTVLGTLIALFIVFACGAAFRLLPLSMKVNGQWQDKENGYELAIKNNQMNFIVPNYSNSKDLSLEYHGKMKWVAVDRYELTDVQVYMVINKEGFSEKDLATIKENSKLYTMDKETEETLRMKYTKETLKEIDEELGLDNFRISLEDFKFGVYPEKIKVRHDAFAINSMSFVRK